MGIMRICICVRVTSVDKLKLKFEYMGHLSVAILEEKFFLFFFFLVIIRE